jgi:hypothetical protein
MLFAIETVQIRLLLAEAEFLKACPSLSLVSNIIVGLNFIVLCMTLLFGHTHG